MIVDPHGREIYYLRISVTDRCNFRCTYCMPASGVSFKEHEQILRYEDIARIAAEAGKLGFTKIRLTGGEPLVRKNIEECIGMVKACGYYNEICMTTNGSLLTVHKTNALKSAGLDRITISLDTLDPDKFSSITRGGNLVDVLKGIDATIEAGFKRTKINMIIFNDTRTDEIEAMRTFCDSRRIQLQLINNFTLSDRNEVLKHHVTPDRPPKCSDCNRIRITSDGFFKPCLFSDHESKIDLNNIRQCIQSIIAAKPQNGVACSGRTMNQIGG